MNEAKKKILLHAFGNAGRGDDGLGSEFITRVEQWMEKNDLTGIDTKFSFQLNVEHAAAIAEYDLIIFADASKADIESFSFHQIFPESSGSFTSHSISPSAILSICQDLYNSTPLVYLLQIKGYRWEFGIGLSQQAKENLENALKFSFDKLMDFQIQE